MNQFYSKNIATFLLLSILVGTSFVSPTKVSAATSDYNSAGAATTDCTTVTEAGAAISIAIGKFMATVTAGTASAVTNVPVQSAAIELNTGTTGANQEGATWWTTYGQPLAKCVVYKAGQVALDKLTTQTVNWIKGGMNGSPYYNIDPNQFEKDLANSVAGNLARQVESLALCDFTSTFKNDLKNWIVMGQPDPALRFQAALKCPFAAVNASDFYRGVQAFTWEHFETALNDSGNPYGVSVIANNELTATQHALANQAKQQLDWGQGFLSVVDPSDCQYPDDATRTYIETGTDWDGNPLPQSQIDALQRQYCKKTTPAQLIQSQLTKATGVEWDRLGLADDLTKIINAFVTKVSNDAIKGIFKK
jgi:hypothetical protein